MQLRRRRIAVHVLIIVATLVLIAVPIWLGTGLLSPGIAPEAVGIRPRRALIVVLVSRC